MEGAQEPRWLTAEEREAWMSLVGVTIQLRHALDTRLRRDAGISMMDYHVLAGLSEAPDRTLRMSALATFAESSLSRLSQVVGRLESRGWITRQPDPCDGRSILATLTDAGMAELQRIAPGHVEAVRELVFDQLTPAQVRQLTTITQRILSAVNPEDSPR